MQQRMPGRAKQLARLRHGRLPRPLMYRLVRRALGLRFDTVTVRAMANEPTARRARDAAFGAVVLARALSLAGLVSALSGCADDAIIREFNDLPRAVATIFDPSTGATLDVAADGGLAPVTFPYAGVPVRVVLDGRASHDPDGRVTEYRWLSGTRALDAGVPARLVPALQPAEWPSDEAMVNVDLGPGVWAFTLWVRDERGAWSAPDTIRVVIGASAVARPADAGTTTLTLTGMDASVRLLLQQPEGAEP